MNAYNSGPLEFYPSAIDPISNSVAPGAQGLAKASATTLATLATIGALMTAAPIVVLLWMALSVQGGWETLAHLASTVLPGALITSFALVAVVLAVVLVVGVGTGWLVAAYEFPGRRWLSWALVLPLSMPAFVLAYAFTDFLDSSGPLQTALRAATGWAVRDYWFPDIRSLPGAGVCLGLALYPYVYMLARSAFSERSESLSDAARSLGLSPRATWWRVVWPVARPAVAAGCALVLMETLADFGTVSYFGIDTLTAGIYRSWQGLGDRVAAARLAVVLLVIVGLLAWAERRQRNRMRFHARASRPARRLSLHGARAWRVSLYAALPVLFGFIVPAVLLLRAWSSAGFPGDARMGSWVLHSLTLAGLATALILPVAVVTAYAARLVGNRSVRVAVALACAGYALPGVVIGVGLLVWVGLIDRVFGMMVLGGTIAAVVYAYGVRFFSVAYQGVESALARISPAMDQSARSLGAAPLEVLARVHWPLLRPSLAASALLVVVDCLKELPATLVLRPFNFDTLAVAAYHFAADERLAEAALPSLLMVLTGLAPVLLLSRAAERHSSRAGDN